ncbi:hypothetical protein MKW98_029670 [Papaver atlanticum]|uniref:FBD domain-containing protein n=1 Tax=Papaver atlanticum TaxID=357466 RepID=A0AAD4XSI0_9MAGN|nr:hypothetical protein MKW98_029670 [Papaver atlanticum]
MTQEYSLTNLSSLVDADIALLIKEVQNNREYPEMYLELPEEDKEKYGKYLLNLLSALRNVKELTLYEGILECLDLHFWLTRGCLRTIVYLLTISPNIESLRLCKNSFTDYPLPPQLGIPDEDDDRNVGGSHRLSLSVKHVSIVGIEGQDNELEFLEFLLKNAVVLEVLDMDSYLEDVSPDRKILMNRYCERLRKLPRASSSLTIKFENICPTRESHEILTWPIA